MTGNKPPFNTKPPKGQPSRLGQAAKNVRVIQKSVEGKTSSVIAEEEGMTRQAVSVILNHSAEAKEYERRIREGFEKLVSDSMSTIARVVSRDDPDSDPSALKASIYVIERVAGKIPEHIKIEEEFSGKSREELLLILRRELEDDGDGSTA